MVSKTNQFFALHASCLFLCECVGFCVLKARVNTQNKHFKLQTKLKHVQLLTFTLTLNNKSSLIRPNKISNTPKTIVDFEKKSSRV